VEFASAQDRAIEALCNRMYEMPGQERFVDRVAESINELMSGKPAARLDFISESTRRARRNWCELRFASVGLDPRPLHSSEPAHCFASNQLLNVMQLDRDCPN
jgi:hypothetical protein